MKQAGIYVNDVFCGILTEDEEGYHFCYEKDYLASQGAVPISRNHQEVLIGTHA